ncbi:uncharacterized protein TNCV_322901 [Trichonephila clavipes]|nr:uncharacterized protein TNCV_322901 [Trichonephila clavipes]
MDEILTTARDLELEVNEDDIEELTMGHEDELTKEELQKILNEEHQKTQRNVSPSEQEEDEREPTPTSAIKDLFKKQAMMIEITRLQLRSGKKRFLREGALLGEEFTSGFCISKVKAIGKLRGISGFLVKIISLLIVEDVCA